MKRLFLLVVVLFSMISSSWGQEAPMLTEEQAFQRGMEIAVEQGIKLEGWINLKTSSARFNGKEWVIFLNPKPDENGGIADGDHYMLFLTPQGEFIRRGFSM